jgi:hypothetical protein
LAWRSWGNGDATLWRGLRKELARRGNRVVFFERDVPYHALNRDLTRLPYGERYLYASWQNALPVARGHLANADVAMPIARRARPPARQPSNPRCGPTPREGLRLHGARSLRPAGLPKLHFVERCYAGDRTNWWARNRACSRALLRSAGFAVVARLEDEVFICRRRELPGGSQAVYPAKWRNDARSSDDLERAQQQIALGL